MNQDTCILWSIHIQKLCPCVPVRHGQPPQCHPSFSLLAWWYRQMSYLRSCQPFAHPHRHTGCPLLGTNLRSELKHNWKSWIINFFSFFFPLLPTDSTCNALSTWCTASLVYLLKAFSVQPVMYIWLRQSGWAWTLRAMAFLMVIHVPQGNSYLDIALWSCLSSYRHVLYMDYPRWMAVMQYVLWY